MPEPPPSTAGVLLLMGPAAPRLRPSPHSAHLPSPRRARFPQGLARRSAPGPFLAHRFGAETLAQRLRFTVSKKRTSLGSDPYFPQRGQVSAARSDHWHELNVGIAVAGQTKGPFRENALTFGSSIQSGAHREYRRGCKGIGR